MSTEFCISDVRRDLNESKKKVSEFLNFRRAALREGELPPSAEEIKRRALEALDLLFDDETGSEEQAH